jgi:hypothetical protein
MACQCTDCHLSVRLLIQLGDKLGDGVVHAHLVGTQQHRKHGKRLGDASNTELCLIQRLLDLSPGSRVLMLEDIDATDRRLYGKRRIIRKRQALEARIRNAERGIRRRQLGRGQQRTWSRAESMCSRHEERQGDDGGVENHHCAVGPDTLGQQSLAVERRRNQTDGPWKARTQLSCAALAI